MIVYKYDTLLYVSRKMKNIVHTNTKLDSF